MTRLHQFDLFPFGQHGGSVKHKPGLSTKRQYDPWKAVYERGRDVLGQHAGGQITLLRKLFDDNPGKVLAKIEDAAEHRDPPTWLAAFLWTVKDPEGKLSGEYIPGGWSAF